MKICFWQLNIQRWTHIYIINVTMQFFEAWFPAVRVLETLSRAYHVYSIPNHLHMYVVIRHGLRCCFGPSFFDVYFFYDLTSTPLLPNGARLKHLYLAYAILSSVALWIPASPRKAMEDLSAWFILSWSLYVPSSIHSTAIRQHTKNRSPGRAFCGVTMEGRKLVACFPKSYYVLLAYV